MNSHGAAIPIAADSHAPSSAGAAPRVARVFEYGSLPYGEALSLQRQLALERIEGRARDDAIVLLEHPPTYTLGRSAKRENILLSAERLAADGIEVVETDRGGDVTCHAPGQLVLYPIVDLHFWRRDIAAYVRALEEIAIRVLRDFGIQAWRGESARGVWTERGKIAALGVRVRRWVTSHGLSLNVNPRLELFRGINPCGAPGAAVTSMAEEGFDPARAPEVREAILEHFAKLFDRSLIRAEDEPGRRPRWLKAAIPSAPRALDVRRLVREKRLHTVCSSAHCPNAGECWGQGTATFLINGDICTRSCRFCAVLTGRPRPLDPGEPRRVAEAAETLGLRHVVVTSVDRDDLPDGGAGAFAETIAELRRLLPGASVEVLIPDFGGNLSALRTVFEARPDVLNHNIETVERLYRTVRPQARYERSLGVLRQAAEAGLAAKSGLMLGLGERRAEVEEALRDLLRAGCSMVTIGQYLRPSARHHPVVRFAPPEEFDHWREFGLGLGFARVESAPLVRSSFHAALTYQASLSKKDGGR